MSIYSYTLNDAPGVAAANNFISFFNPASSTETMSAIQAIITNYDTGSSTTPNSLTFQRISAASGGTPVPASSIGRFVPSWPDPSVQVRIGNPAITTTGLVLAAFAPPFAGIGALGINSTTSAPPGTAFLCPPGTGVAFSTAAGSTSQMWNVTFSWAELP